MALDDKEMLDLIERGNKTIESVKSQIDTLNGQVKDVVHEEPFRMAVKAISDQFEAERTARADRELALEEKLRAVEVKANRPGQGGGVSVQADEYKTAFIAWMRNPKDRAAEQKLYELEKKATDVRTSVAGSGGYALPEQIATEIAKTERLSSAIRQHARVVQVGSSDYKEILDRNGSTTAWVGEAGAYAQTNTPDLVECAPTMGSLIAYPQATVESLDDLFFNVEAWLIGKITEDFAVGEATAFVSGNGTNKPTGFLTGTPVVTADATRAYGVLQYFASGDAATLGTAPLDLLKAVFYGTKSGYRTNAIWGMNSATMGVLSLLKDSTGVGLLQRSAALGDPDTILGRPVAIFEDMPDIAANALPIAFGDFSRGYLIVDRVGIRVLRDEITAPGYVKWAASKRVGGKIKDSDAIKLVKCIV